MRIGIIGGGAIARLFLEHIRRGDMGEAEVAAIQGRSETSRGKALADAHHVPYVSSLQALVEKRPSMVIEAASHDAVRECAEPLLERGIAVMVLSGGALCDDALRARLESAAARNKALLYVPSGGIGGLDALKAACAAGVDSVEIAVTKPPAAWKGIAYVENMNVDLDRLDGPLTLFDGTAREGVPHFPANVNIAAALSMAGIGFDRTRLKVVADPALTHNTHYINIRGITGSISMKFESVPFPDNPKTAMLACYSALAAFRQFNSPVRYGT
jgi:aspartate dehydrogenase